MGQGNNLHFYINKRGCHPLTPSSGRNKFVLSSGYVPPRSGSVIKFLRETYKIVSYFLKLFNSKLNHFTEHWYTYADDISTRELYKYVFPARLSHATLACIGLMATDSGLTPTGQQQARWSLRVFKGHVILPPTQEMLDDISEKAKYLCERYGSYKLVVSMDLLFLLAAFFQFSNGDVLVLMSIVLM